METFYDRWLRARESIEESLARSPYVARDREIPWVRTRQDAKVKLMVGRELGFATMGSNVLKGEIPVGWHTGRHRHGEEALHILQGRGTSIIAGQRFDWHQGSTLHVPYWAEHQHFNTGDEPVVYISAMVFDLERFVGLARIEQLSDCGPTGTDDHWLPEEGASEHFPDGTRALIHIEDAPDNAAFEPMGDIAAVQNQHDFTQYLMVPGNGFRNTSVGITHQWTEPPYHHSGRHKHLEAVVYAVAGEGYTELNGNRVEWEAGDVLYVPPAMWEHEHTNDNPNPITQLRIAFGIRTWFTDIWPEGFTSQRIYDAAGMPIEAGRIAGHGLRVAAATGTSAANRD